MDENDNFIQEEAHELRDDLKDEVSGSFELINFIFQFAGFFAGLLKTVIVNFTQLFNKK